ncbi:MAG: cheYIII [Caulobacteraceae bacterium]|nr:cheYIII [Caulobacteraceae bacterium]
MTEQRLNLSKSNIMLLQNSGPELDILGQLFVGFAVKSIRKCQSIAEASEAIRTGAFDLIVVDADMPDNAGFDFIAHLRRAGESANRLAPILLTCGHTTRGAIRRAINCGANFVVAKPITPKIMFDRVIWLARDEREFVDCEVYAGPDRRRRSFGPPVGMKGRRSTDLSAALGAPVGPDMSQSAIDAMFSSKKAVA